MMVTLDLKHRHEKGKKNAFGEGVTIFSSNCASSMARRRFDFSAGVSAGGASGDGVGASGASVIFSLRGGWGVLVES